MEKLSLLLENFLKVLTKKIYIKRCSLLILTRTEAEKAHDTDIYSKDVHLLVLVAISTGYFNIYMFIQL